MGQASVSTVIPALLRAPPFKGLVEPPAHSPRAAHEAEDCAGLFEALREARVGGRFWAKPVPADVLAEVIVRPRAATDREYLHNKAAHKRSLLIARDDTLNGELERLAIEGRTEWYMDCDPWSVLEPASELIAHGDDEWIAIACILGVPVHVLSAGPFGSPEETPSQLCRRAMNALMQPLHDPFEDAWLTGKSAIALLAEWRRTIDGNRGSKSKPIVAACGMAWWKRDEIARFLQVPDQPMPKFARADAALAHARKMQGALAVWPSRVSPEFIAEAQSQGVPVVKIEDGFVRSVGLGSNLIPPSSVVVDWQGIYYDPSAPSDLETILRESDFGPELLARARRLADAILAAGISKYTATKGAEPSLPKPAKGRRVVLVAGQVEDDMSFLAGGHNITSNLALLKQARALEPEAEIWWRPHPDVDAGHRIGAIDDDAATEFADHIVRDGSMAQLLDRVDAVHVHTSLTGFEALLRGCEVTCHGTPFYAGWGLTRDLAPASKRRGREIALEELIAGVLITYPRYLDPETRLPCPPEVLVKRIAQDQVKNRQGWIAPLRRLQGRMMAKLRRLPVRMSS